MEFAEENYAYFVGKVGATEIATREALRLIEAWINESQAQSILDKAGPSAFYWMTEIATQLAVLSAAKINGIATNVESEIGAGPVTPESVVRIVVQG